MSFLAPLWLLLAGAAAVPLLIHLLRRRTGARVEFPAARYLARAEQEHSRRLRLRNLLLMVLRVAAVLLLAFAAARPVGRLGGTGHAPTAMAIVLDNSMSTSAIVGGIPVFAELRDAARSLASRAATADRLWLLTADGRVQGGSPRTVLAAIDATEPLAGAGNPAAAAIRAAALASGAGLAERRVAVITDAQATAWGEAVELGDVDVIAYRPRQAAPANRAVVSAAAQPVRWMPRGSVVAGIATRDSAAYRVTLGERTLARGAAAPPPGGGSAEVVVRANPPERGWLAGAVELAPDEMRGDDVRHFAAWIGAPPAVALDPGAGPFVRSAIESMEAGGLVTRGAGVGVVPADALRGLPSVIIAPSNPVRIGAANRALDRAGVPWRFGAVVPTPGIIRGDRLDGVDVSERFRLVPQGGAPTDTLARVGNDPWAVAGEGYVLIASPLDPRATSLPARAAFVPWLADMVTQRLARDAGVVLAAAPGDSVTRPSWAESLEMPDGSRRVVAGATIAAPARPGVHFLSRAGRRAGALVVNTEPAESELGRLAPDEIRDRLRGRSTSVADGPGAWDAMAFAGATRQPLLAPALLAVALLLLGEALVATYGMRRAA